jgi:small subunit ribosomal protein S17
MERAYPQSQSSPDTPDTQILPIPEIQVTNTLHQKFNKRQHLLVHDPRSSLREGDIISISPGWRASKHVHHVVSSIIAPFGEPIEARPAVPSEEERMKEREEKLRLKNVRRGKIADINAEDGDGSRALGEDGIDGREVKTTDEVLSGVQEAREEVREVKGVNP